MNRILSVVIYVTLITFIVIWATTHVFAHTPGQPPFFEVNGKYADFYPVLNAYGTATQLPQDIAPESYLVNTPITFHIDTDKLLIPLAVVNDTTFSWDFGDSQKGTGLTQAHTYQRPGSYTITIIAQYKSSDPQLFQTMMLDILPSKNYQLPKAVIIVDGRVISDPIIDSITFKHGQVITFNGTQSTHEKNVKLDYTWDFGKDSDASSESAAPIFHDPVITYRYSDKRLLAYPRLRVQDENGFISDTAVQLLSEEYSVDNTKRTMTLPPSKSSIPFFGVFIIGNGIVIMIGLIIYSLKRRINKNSVNWKRK